MLPLSQACRGFLTVLTLALVAAPAYATFGGANGRIAYHTASGLFTIDDGQLLPAGANPRLEPAFSSDGSQIVFLEFGTAQQDQLIKIINSDGTGLRELVSSDAIDPFLAPGETGIDISELSSPAWSADGQRIAFAVFNRLAPSVNGIWSIGVDGSGLRGEVRSGESSTPRIKWPEWSPEGKKIVHWCRYRLNSPSSYKDDLCVVDTATGINRLLPIDLPSGSFYPLSTRQLGRPKWTPDGQRIIFTIEYQSPDIFTHPFYNGPYTRREIFSVRADGTGLKELTSSEPVYVPFVNAIFAAQTRRYLDPVMSPDGKTIIAQADYYENGAGVRGLWSMRADGQGLTRLNVSSNPNELVRSLDWQAIPADLTIYVDDGHDHELNGLKVELRTVNGTVLDESPLTNSGGSYVFKTVAPGEYIVRATLVDNKHPIGAPSFDIRTINEDLSPTEAVFTEHKVTMPANRGLIKTLHFAASDGLEASNVESEHRDRLDDMANIYYRVRQYVDWVKLNLVPDTGTSVEFYTFALYDQDTDKAVAPDAAYYNYQTATIILGTAFSRYEARDGIPDAGSADEAPENGEWHEFTHHLAHTFILPYSCPGTNHGGALNPDTCDSLYEGLAEFLPAVAAQQIDDVSDSNYDGMVDLESNIQAFNTRIVKGRLVYDEDLAVASLLWDLLDRDVDTHPSQVIASTGLHIPYEYTDEISSSLATLWGQLTTSRPRTVADLRQMFGTPALTVNLDAAAPTDIAPVDMVFLMHGFFPIDGDQTISDTHKTHHYDVAAAQRSNPSLPPNAWVGRSDRILFSATGPPTPATSRFNKPSNPDARVGLEIRDSSGTAISGAEVTLVARTTQFAGTAGTEQTSTVTQRIENGDGAPLHYEPPIYFSYLLPTDAALPPCDPVNDTRVTVTVSATINGYTSTDQPSFDNCSFWQAVVTGAPGTFAVSFTLTFPEDSTLPVTSMYKVASESVVLNSTLGYWAFELSCADPVEGGFATGCKVTEYRVDGGELTTYENTVVLKSPGLHVIEYRSADAAGNEEAFTSITLGVGVDPDTDGDGLSDRTEIGLFTNPQDPDSDDDGLADGFEVTYGINPLVFDTDADGLSDGREIQLGTDALGTDSDSDDIWDGEEVIRYQSNPLDSDTDNDGVIDGPDNCLLAANSTQRDSDADGYGNRCDPDFNNNDIVDSNDASLLKARIGKSASQAPNQDLNDSGSVTAADMAILISMFRKPPGPSVGGGNYD